MLGGDCAIFSIFLNGCARHMILLSQTCGCPPAALLIYRAAPSCCRAGIRTVLIVAVFVSLDFLFRLILPADQVLLCLL